MPCETNFPAALPSDCLAKLAGIVLQRELKSRRREAAWSAIKVSEYFVGQFIDDPAEEGVLSSLAPLTDEEAVELMQNLSAQNPAAVFDKSKVLLLVKWLAELIPLLLG